MLARAAEKHRSIFCSAALRARTTFYDKNVIVRQIITFPESLTSSSSAQLKDITNTNLSSKNGHDATTKEVLNHGEPNQLTDINFKLNCDVSQDITGHEEIAEMVYSAGINEGGILLRKRRRDYASKILNSEVFFSAESICHALCGLQNLKSIDAETLLLLSVLTKKMSFAVGELSGKDIGDALFGMQGMNSKISEVQSMLSALTRKLQNNLSQMDAVDIGKALFGMQNFTEKDKQVVVLLRCLMPKMRSCKQAFTSKIVGDSLFGLRRMRCSTNEVRDFIILITAKIEETKDIFAIEDMANAINGLQSLDGNSRPTQCLVMALLPKLIKCPENFNSKNIGHVLSGLKKLSSTRTEYRELITALVPMIEGNTVGMTTSQMAGALNGLQGMTSENASIQKILLALVPAAEVMKGDFTARTLGMTLYGFKNMLISRQEVRAMLRALLPTIKTSGRLNSPAISASLYALRNMNAEYPEGCMLLRALAENIRTSTTTVTLGGLEIANALFGLQGMSSHRPEVREMVLALTPHIENFKGQLLVNHQSCAIFGLQNMNSDSPEVLGLLKALLPCMTDPVIFNGQNVGNMLFGLQGMRADSDEVKALITAIIPKIKSCNEYPSEQEVGNALFGFKSMSGDCEEVRQLLTVIAPLILGCPHSLTASSLGAALFGLRGCYQAPQIEPIMSFLYEHLANLRTMSNDFKKLTLRDALILAQNLCLALGPLQCSAQASGQRWAVMYSALMQEMKILQQGNEYEGTGSTGKQEKVLLNIVRKMFKGSNIEILNDVFLMDLFQGDIVIKIPFAHDPTQFVTLNIELDGPSHGRERKVFFVDARDKYLRGCGIIIARLDTYDMKKMTEEGIKDWIYDQTALALFQQKQQSNLQSHH